MWYSLVFWGIGVGKVVTSSTASRSPFPRGEGLGHGVENAVFSPPTSILFSVLKNDFRLLPYDLPPWGRGTAERWMRSNEKISKPPPSNIISLFKLFDPTPYSPIDLRANAPQILHNNSVGIPQHHDPLARQEVCSCLVMLFSFYRKML